MKKISSEDALSYHSRGRKGKIQVVPTKPTATQWDLSLAYSPGVAIPCQEIERDPLLAYEYTAKGNLVAVISNGTAVLGLGNIGALAGKPVMEGKGVLFKRFADIDVFDLELATTDPEELIRAVKLLEPTFGGINLEDIRAPECFEIERRLKAEMKIPVFHDDQHGTAIISGAALLNALVVVSKRIEDVRIVFSGAGAAALSCARLYLSLGARRENVVLCDRHGVVYRGREVDMEPNKEDLAADTPARTLAEAMTGADVFIGLSVGGVVTSDMVRSMARDPIVFAMANPDPEIGYEEIRAARPDAIAATGRSDYPNQVNNVLGFPFLFRGALDVRATDINEPMKLAAVEALAALAREDVPDAVLRAYGLDSLRFGRDYILPKPFDYRVLLRVPPAVARAAMASGVARVPIADFAAYQRRLETLISRRLELMRGVLDQAKRSPRKVVFPEGEHEQILRAAKILVDEGIAHPILLARREMIADRLKALDLPEDRVTIIHSESSELFETYARRFHEMRRRDGITLGDARKRMRLRNYYGAMMVEMGDADGLISGLTQPIPTRFARPCRSSAPGPECTGFPAPTFSSSRTGCFSSPTRRSTSIPLPRSWRRSRCSPSASPAASASCRGWPCSRFRTSAPTPIPWRARSAAPWRSSQGWSRTWRSTARCRPTPPSSSPSCTRATRGAALQRRPTSSSSRSCSRPTPPTS
jgi:malate dehydrogenase (oxaloacetate-decarboxylating)(NADP+)